MSGSGPLVGLRVGVEGALLRAWRVCLDLNGSQRVMLAQHAGAARWAYNYALGRKVASHKAFTTARGALLDGLGEPAAGELTAAATTARKHRGPDAQLGRQPEGMAG